MTYEAMAMSFQNLRHLGDSGIHFAERLAIWFRHSPLLASCSRHARPPRSWHPFLNQVAASL